LIICAVLAAAHAAAVANSEKCICQFNQPYGYRGGAAGGSSAQLKALETRVAKLGASVTEIQNYWDNTVAPQRATFKKNTEDLQSRVANLEGNLCGDGQFSCGGDDGQCVSNLFVCDGSKDCANGMDECDSTCSSNVAAGTVLSASSIANDECTRRQPKTLSVVITSAKRLNWFKNQVKVTANINLEFSTGDYEATASLPCSGYYSFANSELVLESPEDDRIGLTCKFSGSGSCAGNLVHEASGESCAQFTLVRQ
jgi:hypothetical protein